MSTPVVGYTSPLRVVTSGAHASRELHPHGAVDNTRTTRSHRGAHPAGIRPVRVALTVPTPSVSFKTRRRRVSVAAGPGCGYGYQMGRNAVLSQLRVTVVAGHSGAVGRSGSSATTMEVDGMISAVCS